jgi:hypothetical protein
LQLLNLFIDVTSSLCAQRGLDKLEVRVQETNLSRHIQVLASDLGERNAFQYQNLEKAANYIRKEWGEFWLCSSRASLSYGK